MSETIPTIALIGCSATKGDKPCRAADLYTGELFKAQKYLVEYAGRAVDAWYVLSAKYGLLLPGKVIGPYEATLSGAGEAARLEWAEMVAESLFNLPLPERLRLVVFAGSDYRGWIPIISALRPDWQIRVPLAGLGIGHQKQAVARMLVALKDARTASATRLDIDAQWEIALATAGGRGKDE